MEEHPLNHQKLQQAISIRDRSYQLLLWLSEKIAQGKIPLSRAANHSGGPAAAIDWIRNYGFVIPAALSPNAAELEQFAAFFSTFVTSSFDVVKRPGTRGEGPIHGCACEICVRIVNAPHLQTKRVTNQDKLRADFLITEWLLEFADASKIMMDVALAEKMVQDKGLRRSCAYLTYGEWLIRRMRGESDGPAILALWRLIAWDPRGGQIRGYQLRIEDFELAEKKVLAALRGL